jgi:GST-like protein
VAYTLYGTRGSGSAAIEMALSACGVHWTRVDAASWKPGSAVEELRRVNPLIQIPTIVLPGGAVLTESAAILIHLATAHPSSSLLPESSASRAQAIRGLIFIAANCYSAVSVVDFPSRWTAASDESAHDAVREGARQRLFHHWDIFADTFAPDPYLSGAKPGALDYLAVVVSMWCSARDHIARSRPLFSQTLRRIGTHDSVAPIFRQHWDHTAL